MNILMIIRNIINDVNKCIKWSSCGVCEILIDDFIEDKISWFKSNPKTHIILTEKPESGKYQKFEFKKYIEIFLSV